MAHEHIGAWIQQISCQSPLYSIRSVCYSVDMITLKRLLSLALLGTVVTLLVVFFWVLVRGIREQGAAPSQGGLISRADIEMEDLHLNQLRDGQRIWSIQAENAVLYDDRNEIVLNNLSATILTADGFNIEFSGDRGRFDTKTQDFEVEKREGELDVQLGNGYTLRTLSLRWVNQDQEVVSVFPVSILSPGFRIQGRGMTADLKTQQFMIREDVRVQVAP